MITAVIALSALALVCSFILALVARAFAVPVNPKVEEIEGALPGANCGGCGLPGCFAARAADRRGEGGHRRLPGRGRKRRADHLAHHGRRVRRRRRAEGRARSLRRRRRNRPQAVPLQRNQGLRLRGDSLWGRGVAGTAASASARAPGCAPSGRSRCRRSGFPSSMSGDAPRATSACSRAPRRSYASCPPTGGCTFSARPTTRAERSARSAASAASRARSASRRHPRGRSSCRTTSRSRPTQRRFRSRPRPRARWGRYACSRREAAAPPAWRLARRKGRRREKRQVFRRDSPRYDKELASGRGGGVDAPSERLVVPLAEISGAAPKPLVKKGDAVKRGQVIAEPQGFVSVPLHAPTSGVVQAIETCFRIPWGPIARRRDRSGRQGRMGPRSRPGALRRRSGRGSDSRHRAGCGHRRHGGRRVSHAREAFAAPR